MAERLKAFESQLGGACACVIALAFTFAKTGIPRWIPLAPTVRFGVPSPLTGITRSFVALANGHPAMAFRLHPLGPLLFVACVLFAARGTFVLCTGREPGFLRRLQPSIYVWLAVGVILLLIWFARIASI